MANDQPARRDRPRLGFIGLGLMGVPMARRLLAAGFPLTVWNRSPAGAATLVAAGAQQADSPAALACAVDVVMLCVADTAAVGDVVFAADGVAAGGAPGKLLVDFSSILPAATREFAARLAAACGMRWVDAPVSGGVPGAEQGTLAVMAGGDAADVERIRPLLAPLAARCTHLGPVGSGQVAKVCNQLIVGLNALAIAEVVALAARSGVDAARLPEAFAGGFADSKPLQILAPRMAAHAFEPVAWKVRTLLKDLDNAGALARDAGLALPLAEFGAQRLRAHGDAGHLDRDPSTLVLLAETPPRD